MNTQYIFCQSSSKSVDWNIQNSCNLRNSKFILKHKHQVIVWYKQLMSSNLPTCFEWCGGLLLFTFIYRILNNAHCITDLFYGLSIRKTTHPAHNWVITINPPIVRKISSTSYKVNMYHRTSILGTILEVTWGKGLEETTPIYNCSYFLAHDDAYPDAQVWYCA